MYYLWSSTEDSSFAYERNGSSIYQKLLTVNDAGVHTCTATDVWGNSGAASTEISLFGNHDVPLQSFNTSNFLREPDLFTHSYVILA